VELQNFGKNRKMENPGITPKLCEEKEKKREDAPERSAKKNVTHQGGKLQEGEKLLGRH